MSGGKQRFNGGARVLHRRAVRTPLPDEEAERVFHENMMAVADGRERKAELLADPDVSLLEAYETEFERVSESFERRLRHVAGDDYEEAAMASRPAGGEGRCSRRCSDASNRTRTDSRNRSRYRPSSRRARRRGGRNGNSSRRTKLSFNLIRWSRRGDAFRIRMEIPIDAIASHRNVKIT